MTVGEKIYKLRVYSGLSQKEFADKVGASQSAINYWENGKRQPRVAQLKKIAKFLNFPLYDLLDDNYELGDIALEKKRARIIGDTEMTEPPKPFTVPLISSNINKYDATVEITPEAMERLKEDAEAREILKKYESGEKILDSEYKKVIEYHNRMMERSKLLQDWLEWYKSTCEPLNNEGRKKVAEYAETLAETDKYTKPKEWFQGRMSKDEVEKAVESYLSDDNSQEPDATPAEPPEE